MNRDSELCCPVSPCGARRPRRQDFAVASYRHMKRALPIFLLLLLASLASGAELFVDQKRLKADDNNAGTEALPFKTIQPAVDAAKAIDETCHIMPMPGRIVNIAGGGRKREFIRGIPVNLVPKDRNWK